MLFAIKVCILVLAFMIAYLLRVYWINPKILEPMCFLNTNQCVQIDYYQKPNENSLLAYVSPSSFRVWFNGIHFYVYVQSASTGQQCTTPGYDPAYIVDTKRQAVQNYQCIRSLDDVMQYYADTPKQSAYIRTASPNDFSAYDVIQYFLKRRLVAPPDMK
jgi:hypothetical protein